MNMRLVLLGLCLVGLACALPVYRSKRSASSEDASHQNDSTEASSNIHDSNSDSSEEDLSAATTAAPSTEAETNGAFTADLFTRGDNGGRGDSMAFEIRAADDEDHSMEEKAWKSSVRSYKGDAQVILDTTAEQADEPDDRDKADDVAMNRASSHQHTINSIEHNSQEDSKQSQPDHSLEEDSHPGSHTSNESPETQSDHSVEENNHASNESPETQPDNSVEVDNPHSSESPEVQPDHSVEEDKQPDTHTSNESPEHHVLLQGLKQATPSPDTESSESSEGQEDSLPHSSVESTDAAL